MKSFGQMRLNLDVLLEDKRMDEDNFGDLAVA